MAALLGALLLILAQDPPVDDIAKSFPDPVPADLAWEMAAKYSLKIASLIRAGDFEQARAWDRMARAKLPDPYRKRLEKEGAEFWPFLRQLPANRPRVDRAAAWFVVALTGGEEKDIPNIRAKIDDRKEFDHETYYHELAVALTRIGDGKTDRALKIFDGIQETYKEEWIPKSLDRYREAIQDMRREGGLAEDLAKASEFAGFLQDRSWGPCLAVMTRVTAALKSGGTPAEQLTLRQVAVRMMKTLGDEVGARAFEDRVVSDPSTPAGESRNVLARRASEAAGRGDHKTAEGIYREILKRWPDDPGAVGTWFDLGVALKMQARFVEGRTLFERLAQMEEPDRPRRGEHGRSYRIRSQFEIGACFEGEQLWGRALEAYLACPDDPIPDGHGRAYRDFKIQEAVLRCRIQLKQFPEALKLCRDHVNSPGGCSPRIVVGYVDLAIATGQFEAEEHRLRAAPADKDVVGVAMALDCVRIAKLRSERDAAGLLAMVRQDYPFQNDRGWEDLRWGPGWLTVEAIECLAELGDDAVDFLVPIARLGVGRAYVALISLARVRNDRARELMKKPDWIEGHLKQTALDIDRKHSKDPPRERRRLPEKKAVPPDPKEAGRIKDKAAKIRERLPELTGKVKGVDELLAQETNAARFQALGETIFAWKKGNIVDEDFEDLVAFALEEKWALDSKTLLALIRTHRAAPAAPLIEPALGSKEPEIRAEAAQMVGMYRLKKCIPVLVELLKDKDGSVFRNALNALVGFKAREHIDAIAAGLKRAGRAPATITALGRLGAIERAEEIAGFLENAEPTCRACAAEALGVLGARQYAGKISVLLQDDVDYVRKAAAEALKKLQ